MRILTAFILILALRAPLAAQNPQGAVTPTQSNFQPGEQQQKGTDRCLIVKHKGTIGRRLMWTALVGVPIAPGAKFEYVDSVNYSGAKMSYTGKDLQIIQGAGVHVIVLDKKSTSEDLANARKSCQ